jgi:Zn-dependent protease
MQGGASPDGSGRASHASRAGSGARLGVPLGSVAGIPVVISPTWLIVAILITVAFAPTAERAIPSLGAARYLVSAAFAVLLYVSVFLHELSHALVARWLGVPVRWITLHLLGGVTELEGEARSPRQDALISVAGPVVSLAAGLLAWGATRLVAGQGLDVPEFLLLELAVANLLVGGFNLLPGLPLDGGHLLTALVWRLTGDRHRATIVAGWAGMVLAALVAVLPWLLVRGVPATVTVLWSLLLAWFLWSAARAAVANGRLRSRLPSLVAGRLARPTLAVVGHVPLEQAEQRARSAGADAMVVVDALDRPLGVVDEAAAAKVPAERRPWIGVASLARRVPTEHVFPAALAGEDLIAAMHAAPADTYLVVDDSGHHSVLLSADVDAALARVGLGR